MAFVVKERIALSRGHSSNDRPRVIRRAIFKTSAIERSKGLNSTRLNLWRARRGL